MKLTQQEKDCIQLTAQNIGIRDAKTGVVYDWLDKTIYLESNYNPSVTNGIGATGLIQFTKTTAKALGTTTEALKRMSFIEQMPYVELYFKRAIQTYGMPRDFISFYCLCFHPAFVNAGMDAKLSAGAYVGNRFLDLDHNGDVTKHNLADSLKLRLAKKKMIDVIGEAKTTVKHGIKAAVDSFKSDSDQTKPVKIFVIAAICAVVLFIIRKIFLIFKRN